MVLKAYFAPKRDEIVFHFRIDLSQSERLGSKLRIIRAGDKDEWWDVRVPSSPFHFREQNTHFSSEIKKKTVSKLSGRRRMGAQGGRDIRFKVIAPFPLSFVSADSAITYGGEDDDDRDLVSLVNMRFYRHSDLIHDVPRKSSGCN